MSAAASPAAAGASPSSKLRQLRDQRARIEGRLRFLRQGAAYLPQRERDQVAFVLDSLRDLAELLFEAADEAAGAPA